KVEAAGSSLAVDALAPVAQLDIVLGDAGPQTTWSAEGHVPWNAAASEGALLEWATGHGIHQSPRHPLGAPDRLRHSPKRPAGRRAVPRSASGGAPPASVTPNIRRRWR